MNIWLFHLAKFVKIKQLYLKAVLCEKKFNNGFEKTPRISARKLYSGRLQSTPRILSSFASVMQISSFISASIAATPKRFLAAQDWSVLSERRASRGDESSGASEVTEVNEASAFLSELSSTCSPVSHTCAKTANDSLNHGTVPADPRGWRFPLAAAELVWQQIFCVSPTSAM